MPSELLALVIASALGWTGYLHKKVDDSELNLERFKTIVAREYMSREQIEAAQDKLMTKLDRIEDKLDFHVVQARMDKALPPVRYYNHDEKTD
jgi:Tfp pilus assembly protein PilO